jgi:hypothetical protein
MFEFLEENNGGISFMRVASLGIISVTLFVWAYTSIKTATIQKMDIEQLMLILGSLGFKLGQKIVENKNPVNPTPNP